MTTAAEIRPVRRLEVDDTDDEYLLVHWPAGYPRQPIGAVLDIRYLWTVVGSVTVVAYGQDEAVLRVNTPGATP